MVVIEACSSQLLTVRGLLQVEVPVITGFAASVDTQHRKEYLEVHFGDNEMRRAAPAAKEIAHFVMAGPKEKLIPTTL
jgi:hypothetical protein